MRKQTKSTLAGIAILIGLAILIANSLRLCTLIWTALCALNTPYAILMASVIIGVAITKKK